VYQREVNAEFSTIGGKNSVINMLNNSLKNVPGSANDYMQVAQDAQQPGLLRWWYRISTSSQLLPNASFRQREKMRRAQLTSVMLLVEIAVLIAAIPSAITGPNPILLPDVLSVLVLMFIAIPLNRLGYVNIAGTLVAIGFELGVLVNLSTQPGGLDPISLPLFGILTIPIMLSASLLPEGWVFLVAAGNTVFIWIAFTYLPRTPAMSQIMATPLAYFELSIPITLQILLSVTAFLWVRGAIRAIARADRAEEIAKLERHLAEQERDIAEQRTMLESGVQQILQTLVQAANGNISVRAPLMQMSLLAQISVALNNLLNRLQRNMQAEQNLNWTRNEIIRLTEAIQLARATHSPVRIERGGTPLDMLILELQGHDVIETKSNNRHLPHG
jgi:hypothetical protein